MEFCRARLLPLEIPRFARDPLRALSNMTITLAGVRGEGLRAHLAGLGLGEASASNGVPIIGPIAHKLSKISTKGKVDENIKYMYGAAGDPLDIDDAARQWFYEVYGWSPEFQKMVELTYIPKVFYGSDGNTWYDSLPLGPRDLVTA